MYWKARTYSTYNGKGWLSEHTVTEPLGYRPEFTLPLTDRQRSEVTYFVTPLYESKKLFSGDQVLAVDRDVMIETQAASVYIIDLLDLQRPDSNLPGYLEEVGGTLRAILEQGDGLVSDSMLALSLPTQFRLDKVDRVDGQAVRAQITEALPAVPEVLSVTSPHGKFKIGDPYQVTSAISSAEPEELQTAGEEYPAWVSDRYLQLPPDLPARVNDLAASVTSGWATPYEKAKVVENYLKNNYPYNLRIDPPPFGVDGVDHFLFGLGEGYSEYFGSTMAVMLRTVGVPARLAVGYTTGDRVEGREIYVVTDSHSHAWVEVYFPRFGWIPFEPTPGKSLPRLYQPGLEDQEILGTGAILAELLDEGCLDESDDCFDPEDASATLDLVSDSSDGSSVLRYWPWLLTVIAGLAVVGGSLALIWRRFLATPNNPRVAFRRMNTLASLAAAGRVEYQTPYQFGSNLQQELPSHSNPVSLIVFAYVRNRYGNKDTTASERRVLAVAWKKIRLPMLWAIVRHRLHW
jgi:hypothetical protein